MSRLRPAAVCACLLFWFALFGAAGLFTSGFQLIDDHTLVEISADLAAPDAGLLGVMRKWVTADFDTGRFRPLYYPSRVLRTEAFGLSSAAWSIDNAVLAGLTSAGLFLLGTGLGFTTVSSLALALWSTLGRPSTIWWRLGTPETEGNFLLTLSLLLVAGAVVRPRRRAVYEAAAVLPAVLASLTKEGMILYLPVVAAMRMWMPCWLHGAALKSALRDSRGFASVVLAIGGLELLGLLLTVGTAGTGYGGVDASSFSSGRLRDAVGTLASVAALWLPFAATATALASAAIRGPEQRGVSLKPLMLAWLIFLVAAVPQVLLYAKSGWADHYFNPIILACAWLLVLAVEYLRRIHGALFLAFALLMLVPISPRFQWTRLHAREYAASGVALGELLRAVDGCARGREPLLLVANPRVHYEEAFSLRTFLMAGWKKGEVYLGTAGASGAHIFSDALSREERARSFLDPVTLEEHYFRGAILPHLPHASREGLQAILLLSPERLQQDVFAAAADWLRPQRYRTSDFDLSGIRVRLLCRQHYQSGP